MYTCNARKLSLANSKVHCLVQVYVILAMHRHCPGESRWLAWFLRRNEMGGFSKDSEGYSRRHEVLDLEPFYMCIFGPDLSWTPSFTLADNDSCRGQCRVRLLNHWQSRLGTIPMITSMKFFITVVLISLFATVQAQFSFGAPAPGSTISAGQNVTLQIIVPIDTVNDTFCLHVVVACLLPTQLEWGSRRTGSQPCNRHCWLSIVLLSSTICKPGWYSFHREISVPGRDWQHTPVIRELHFYSSRWHIRPSFLPSTAQLFTYTTSKFDYFYKLSNSVILTLLQKNQAIPTIECQSLAVEVSSWW